MSRLTLSTNQITFEPNDSVKTVLLTNVGGNDLNRRPIMYKIKTNKIDFVDAKPSCGYISGLKGQNQIGVLIRSLTAKKEFSAKLQILYVSHERITEELVERNKRHFDLIEYNELYDSIKQGSQNDVKSEMIIVNRKAVEPTQDSAVSSYSDEKGKLKLTEENSLLKEKGSGRFDTIPIERKKGSSLGSLLLMLVIGMLIGFWLGANYGKNLGFSGESKSLENAETSQTLKKQQGTNQVENKINERIESAQQFAERQSVNEQELIQQQSNQQQQGNQQQSNKQPTSQTQQQLIDQNEVIDQQQKYEEVQVEVEIVNVENEHDETL